MSRLTPGAFECSGPIATAREMRRTGILLTIRDKRIERVRTAEESETSPPLKDLIRHFQLVVWLQHGYEEGEEIPSCVNRARARLQAILIRRVGRDQVDSLACLALDRRAHLSLVDLGWTMSAARPLRDLVARYRRICRLVWRVHGVRASPADLTAKTALRTELLRRSITTTAIEDLGADHS